ncbi:hypothetical protein F511_07465 [Dorcoceras hygrometricum]|uniref:BHLH domain-containing protein n=1 Tax=Dorcoceras hygrometricum TaxID=472368 RepID=A0A2Z7CEK0_9LAMI|nr:hypothetical protein F511_07465 [Dorcoceras hygrometricum]
MGSRARIPSSAAVRKMRRSSNWNRKPSKPQACHRRTAHIGDGTSVSEKLEALKNLIPSQSSDIKPDQLFQETADYIVLLKARIFVLQNLIECCGSSQLEENRNAV